MQPTCTGDAGWPELSGEVDTGKLVPTGICEEFQAL